MATAAVAAAAAALSERRRRGTEQHDRTPKSRQHS
jgi:hypothetical protein